MTTKDQERKALEKIRKIVEELGEDSYIGMALAAHYDADIEKAIREYNEKHLTPANAMVGDGATVVFYTDRVACTIISVTPKTITLQRDRATLDPKFEPHIIPGGFCGHCINQDEQEYTYEPDPQGTKYKFHWSDKYQQYGQPDNLRAIKGRYEFYDFNF